MNATLKHSRLVKLILKSFPSASGILLFGSQTHSQNLLSTTDIDLLITAPVSYIKNIHKIKLNNHVFDINLIPEINFENFIYKECHSSIQSSYIDALLTGKILFDKKGILTTYKDFTRLISHNTNTKIHPTKILDAISFAEKICVDIKSKQPSLGQFLLTSLLINKLIDIEMMINLDKIVISPKFKAAQLKAINPEFHSKLESVAFGANTPNYIQNIYKLASTQLTSYQTGLNDRSLYERSYFSGKQIWIEFDKEIDLLDFIYQIQQFINSEEIKNIQFYYLLTPFKLINDHTNKLVLTGRSLERLVKFIALYEKKNGVPRTGAYPLPDILFGGATSYLLIEKLIMGICRLLLKGSLYSIDPLLIGIYLIICFVKVLYPNKKVPNSFSTYLSNSWICFSYDSQHTSYRELINAKEAMHDNFKKMTSANKDITHFIKMTRRPDYLPAAGWQKKMSDLVESFVQKYEAKDIPLKIPTLETNKIMECSDQAGQRPQWFIYRKALELIFFNLKIDEKDFSLLAFLIKES